MKARCQVAAAALCALIGSLLAHAQQSPAAIVLSAEYEISGVVTDSVTGVKLGAITVRIAPAENRPAIQTVKTGNDGSFRFQHLARGKYSLDANGRGYPEQGFNQHEYYSTAIVVGPGLKSTDIAFRLHPEGTIRGTVVDEENDPVQNASVRLFTTVMENGEVRTRIAGVRMTDDLGHFSFTHLAEAAYYVAVSGRPWYAVNAYGRGFRFVEGAPSDSTSSETEAESDNLDKAFPLTFYDGALSSAEATAIDLQPGQTTTADFTLRAVPSVHISIPRIASEPVRRQGSGGAAEVVITRQTFTPREVQLFHTIFNDMLLPAETTMTGNPDGSERIEIAPGHYVMQVVTPQEGREGGSYREIDVSGDMDLPTDAASLTPVTGVARFETPHQKLNLSVVIANRQLSRGYGARITGEGEFEFDQPIMPGRYEVSIGSGDGWYLKSFTASGATASGRTLEISGSNPVRLTLNIGHGLARVDGVAVREGKPWAGAMILLVPQDAANSNVLVRRDQSDSDGTFTLYNVVPGRYTLLALEDGWRLPWSNPKVLQGYLAQGHSIEIPPGARTEATVQVQQAH